VSDESRAEALALRATARRERSAALVAAIHAWAHRQRPLPESSLGKAIAYMLGLWPGLTRFLDDPRIALDNNATERALRGMVIGRKNHYGSRSKRGTGGRRPLLQPHRVGEALRRRAEGVPAVRHVRRAQEPRNRHSPARAPDLVRSSYRSKFAPRPWEGTGVGNREYLQLIRTAGQWVLKLAGTWPGQPDVRRVRVHLATLGP
jgi:hypothetical protein